MFTKQEIGFFYKPSSPESDSFIKKHFDVLIDVNFKNILQLHYISSLSDARFKVGLFEQGNGNTPFDLIMEINKPVGITDYLNQVIHYLEMINSGTTKKA